ncbi:carboxynorspermidine decarboxylase [Parabacteroides sp. PF5-5]|uniref:carboxynorspermidine decarboxylase n=1 Tax=unclassified Parabacteroides TaxID=2649774 RepID=UPI00247410FE|nr:MULTISPECIES: carboxynorspermidine decarboxylase [unclassified Parabacteroides]MDH6303834.1 carboxynorspermidine decarboxylase [Parabacteroides sp. PH5-39]MDH6314451.1 carboxynorspermidine decarboxylase [Parabacteroides sp. PF5-13]MDH6318484.1 carboxynorspermidine decarboxylase [Parabacteroides sp. PH5-13]MDH6322223.1 carboxynorspermidine decarboxylase [Parabacteroides sp. PH5-8]MDH6325697.1 carboxynorspermidine decarboxylase [Parabacteroides sp. PH5-41]
MIDYNKIPSPCYVMEEKLLRRNLELIKHVKEEAGVDIILAFKAFAMWKSFPIIHEYIPYSTASSKYEAQLAYEEMGSLAHTYSPAYTEEDFPLILKYSSHITFNSLSQFERFYPMVKADGNRVSCGLRINPEYSVVDTDLYNPTAPGSRMGIVRDLLGERLPEGVEGLHFHALCESSSYDLEKMLEVVEERFGCFLPSLKWLNMGGGHLMTRKDYDTDHLIALLKRFNAKYPSLKIILEPGSAFAWQTGFLLTTVVDIVENHGIKTAIIDASFTCHMPDCLEMPYKPAIRNATDAIIGKPTYRIGGNSCLSGDFMGDWSFDEPLQIGDRLIFEDMIHYTIVKTNMFNGIPHPSIALINNKDELVIYKMFGYEDYKQRNS